MCEEAASASQHPGVTQSHDCLQLLLHAEEHVRAYLKRACSSQQTRVIKVDWLPAGTSTTATSFWATLPSYFVASYSFSGAPQWRPTTSLTSSAADSAALVKRGKLGDWWRRHVGLVEFANGRLFGAFSMAWATCSRALNRERFIVVVCGPGFACFFGLPLSCHSCKPACRQLSPHRHRMSRNCTCFGFRLLSSSFCIKNCEKL